MKSLKAELTHCPCDSDKFYQHCCALLHQQKTPAASAEALMRSRYSAYVLGLAEYLLQTWHIDTRPALIDLNLDLNERKSTQWLGLKIKQSRQLSDSSATVEFVARYKIGGKAERLHEMSRFIKIGKHWFYVDGDFIN